MSEATEADLVLHVVNSGHPHFEEQVEVGNQVLEELGVLSENIMVVYNKADLPGERRRFPRNSSSVTISALNGTGMDGLLEEIRARELARGQVLHLQIPMDQSKVIAKLYEIAQIRHESSNDHHMTFIAWVPNDQIYLFTDFENGASPAEVAEAS
jgi:GTP-binding protein HflX